MSNRIPFSRTTNWSRQGHTLKRRGFLMLRLRPKKPWFTATNGKSDHPEQLSAAAIQFCLLVKVRLKLTLQQTKGLVASVPALSKLRRLAGAELQSPPPSALDL